MHDFDKLELNTETIRELTGDELGQVAGGAQKVPTIDGCFTGTWTDLIPTNNCTGYYPSLNAPCTGG
ncbi:MAG TPA: hypothetical protein VF529_19400 [Solirubrobacteraceae bacterium]|jgi:hypothetical protein